MALKDKFIIKRSIELNLEPKDWELYKPDSIPSRTAAKMMNRQLEIIINGANGSESLDSIRQQCGEVMSKYSKHGAYDSEPLKVMEYILQEYF